MIKDQGWIKLHRKLMDKGYYKKSEIVHLWVHILFKANHKPNEFYWNKENIKVERGQFITGRKALSEETGINESSIERILKMLENEQQIEQQKTTKFRLISVKNWDYYQTSETSGQQNEQQVNNKRTTSEQQVNTNKNDNNVKNDNNDKKKDLPGKTPALHSEIIKSFTDYYFKTKNVEYIFNGGKDGTATKQIIAKLKKICSPDKQTDEDISKAFQYMISNITDTWILDNLDLPVINSKFNQIISTIKNGKSTNNDTGQTKGFDIRKNSWIAGTLENAIQLTRENSN